MITSESKVRVRYSETDKMGYVYHGNYTYYYEVGRTNLMRQLGLTYRELEETGIGLPLSDLQSKFIKPARYDEELTVRTIVKEKPTVRMRFDYEIYNPENELVNTGITTLVFIDLKTNRPCRPPVKFSKIMEQKFD